MSPKKRKRYYTTSRKGKRARCPTYLKSVTCHKISQGVACMCQCRCQCCWSVLVGVGGWCWWTVLVVGVGGLCWLSVLVSVGVGVNVGVFHTNIQNTTRRSNSAILTTNKLLVPIPTNPLNKNSRQIIFVKVQILTPKLV